MKIHNDVLKMVKDFMETGCMNPTLNKTQITLVPKIRSPERLDQLWPNSFCKFDYKIIPKVLPNRLKQWLPELIEMEQSAFVSGRQLRDNILIVQEILH